MDLYLTTIPEDFIDSCESGRFEKCLCPVQEDIILSKIGRYSAKDIEDISATMEKLISHC